MELPALTPEQEAAIVRRAQSRHELEQARKNADLYRRHAMYRLEREALVIAISRRLTQCPACGVAYPEGQGPFLGHRYDRDGDYDDIVSASCSNCNRETVVDVLGFRTDTEVRQPEEIRADYQAACERFERKYGFLSSEIAEATAQGRTVTLHDSHSVITVGWGAGLESYVPGRTVNMAADDEAWDWLVRWEVLQGQNNPPGGERRVIRV